MSAASAGAGLLDLLLPSGCVACAAWIPGGTSLVCTACRLRLREPPWPRCPRCHHPRGTGRADQPDCLECRPWPSALTAARYAYALEPPADDLVHALKYEGWRELADFMARAVARVVRREIGPGGPATRVVPVPTTATRLRRRGYNQAGLVAARVAELLGVPCREALRRADGARSQTALAPDERRRNVRGAFEPAWPSAAALPGAHVLLVDDVLTTGATAGEAAVTLAAAGAASVTLLAFARALPGAARRAA